MQHLPTLRWKGLPSPDVGGTFNLLAPLVLAAGIPMLLFGIWIAYISAEKERAETQGTVAERVRNVTDRVSGELQANLEAIASLSVSTALDRPDLEAFYKEALRLRSRHPLWHTIELTDPSGRQILNLLRPLGEFLGPTADRKSFDKVVRTLKPVVSDIGPIGPISGLQLVSLRVPVIRDDDLRYVLSVALAPQGVSSILRDAGVPEGWVGAILDANGNYVARTMAEPMELGRPAPASAREAITRAREGAYEGVTLEGVPTTLAFQTLPHTEGWTVHFGIATEKLDTPIRRSRYFAIGGAAASLILSSILAALVAKDVARRRQEEEARAQMMLRASEEYRAIAVDAAELGTWRWMIDMDVIEGDRRAAELFGRSSFPADGGASGASGGAFTWRYSDLIGAVHPDDRASLDANIRASLTEGRLLDTEFRAVLADGKLRWVRVTGRLQHGEQEQPGREPPKVLHGVIADIDPRKRSEAEHTFLLRRLAQAQEDERRHIARDLHDQVGQTVTGLGLGLKGLEDAVRARSGGGDPILERIRWLRDLTEDIGRDLHRAASDLRPTALDDLGLTKALQTYAKDWSARYGISIDVQFLGYRERLSVEIETIVYRIVQEALTNVLKHASAGFVSVLVEQKDEALRVIVEDDGRGFSESPRDGRADAEEGGEDGGRPRLGLSGIRERLSLVGGRLMIESSPGAGTTLYISVPIRPSEGRAAT
ncbi:ATP-binding protein [Azospirillum sp. SYSU D00513]|uniref:ATP-binding protein n=1 Tax=Azospirillum sp. SYSU D00513 TaxID=2812561 RepID=UPI001A95AC7F|nr:ATP-binding protein [Azospirillum sp. SYSU D00513]